MSTIKKDVDYAKKGVVSYNISDKIWYVNYHCIGFYNIIDLIENTIYGTNIIKQIVLFKKDGSMFTINSNFLKNIEINNIDHTRFMLI